MTILKLLSDQYCIRVTSSADVNLCQHYIEGAGPQNYPGGDIHLKRNGHTVAIIPRPVIEYL